MNGPHPHAHNSIRLPAVAATPVYELYEDAGIEVTELPPAANLVGGELAFFMHDGGHGLVPSDWNVYLDFMERYLTQ